MDDIYKKTSRKVEAQLGKLITTQYFLSSLEVWHQISPLPSLQDGIIRGHNEDSLLWAPTSSQQHSQWKEEAQLCQ